MVIELEMLFFKPQLNLKCTTIFYGMHGFRLNFGPAMNINHAGPRTKLHLK